MALARPAGSRGADCIRLGGPVADGRLFRPEPGRLERNPGRLGREQFPKGDLGGNRPSSASCSGTACWGLFTARNIGSDVWEIEAVMDKKAANVQKEIDTPDL
jgi:hypothetical protein